MSDESDAPFTAYVEAAARLTQMPLSPERLAAVAAVLRRVAGFAAHVGAFALADEVEVAGVFTP